MLKKSGSYFADWRDATGKRHRKAFPTLQEAVDYTEQMRATARPESPNSHPPRPHSRKPRRSTSARKRTTRTRKPRSRRS